MKTGSPTLNFQHPAANVPQFAKDPPVPLQRTAMHRQQARRSGQNFLPKLAPGQSAQEQDFAGQTPPTAHPTPSSHTSSPTTMSTRSPLVMQQGGNTPPTSALLAQPQQQQFQAFPRPSQQQPNQAFYHPQPMSPQGQRMPQQRPTSTHCPGNASAHSSLSTGSRPSLNHPMSAGSGGPGSTGGQSASAYYPSPFQKHIDQLGKFSRSLLLYRTLFVLG